MKTRILHAPLLAFLFFAANAWLLSTPKVEVQSSKAAGASSSRRGEQDAPPTLKRDIEYAVADGERLKLDLSIPAGVGPFPAVIQVHGGGWAHGDKNVRFLPLFAALTKAGFAWFSVNYRLAPAHTYPASSDDVDAAIRWVKAHAVDYNIDPARIALVGQSAGGYLVELAAAVKAYLGLTADMLTPEARKLMGEASPAAHVRADLPPFLLLHGDADRVVPFELSAAFQQKLRDAGVPCELVTVKRGIHGTRRWDDLGFDYSSRVIAWLQKTLNQTTQTTKTIAL